MGTREQSIHAFKAWFTQNGICILLPGRRNEHH